jgi:hypothetical protein
MRWGRLVALGSVVALAGAVAACSGDESSDDAGGRTGTTEAESAAGDSEAGGGCSRDELQALADDYLAALAAHHPEGLPLASDVKATENGEEVEPGEGLWQSAGEARFTRTVVDPERCGTHTQAVLDDGGQEAIFGVRLQLADGEISEVETYVTHEGDYFLFSPDGLAESDQVEGPITTWDEPVPEEQRATRQELADIADSYFESFGPAGYVAPMRQDCWRWENGQRTTAGDCTVGLPAEGTGRGNEMITNRRYQVADVETGVVVAYVRFLDALDFHMFKVVGGEIRLIQAVVTASGHESTGWEEQEEAPGQG